MNDEFDALMRRDFLAFAGKSMSDIKGERMNNDRYLEAINSQLMRTVSGESLQLVVNLPPRHLKTWLCAVCLTAWLLARKPSLKIIIVSYAETTAKDIARDVRAILRAPWFRRAFPKTKVDPSHAAVTDFATTAGGKVYAASLTGSIIGKGADYIIIDDAHNTRESLEQIRATVANIHSTVFSRLNNPDKGRIIIIGQRVHEEDLSASLLREGIWAHLMLPLIATEPMRYITDSGPWVRPKGDVLRPDAFSEAHIKYLQSTTHNPDFSLLYQQGADDLAPPAINAAHFRIYPGPLPAGLPIVLSIDPGTSAGPGKAFNCFQVWGVHGSEFILVDQWRARCDFPELLRQYRRMLSRYQPCRILIEATANGPALASSSPAGAPVQMIVPRGSKTARLRRNIAAIVAGQVWTLAGLPGLGELLSEVTGYPHVASTDQIDALTQFLDLMRTNPHLVACVPRRVGSVTSRGGGGSGPQGGSIAGDAPPRRGRLRTPMGVVSPRR